MWIKIEEDLNMTVKLIDPTYLLVLPLAALTMAVRKSGWLTTKLATPEELLKMDAKNKTAIFSELKAASDKK